MYRLPSGPIRPRCGSMPAAGPPATGAHVAPPSLLLYSDDAAVLVDTPAKRIWVGEPALPDDLSKATNATPAPVSSLDSALNPPTLLQVLPLSVLVHRPFVLS